MMNHQKTKVIFLGCTQFSHEILSSLMENPSINIQAIFSIPEKFQISYSDKEIVNTSFSDLSTFASNLDVPFNYVNSSDKRIQDYDELISRLEPDVILVMGWYYMVPKKIRELAKCGAWGIHASLLPDYAGGAPLVWAIINGEEKTGVTLFRLEDGVDDGDIIGQTEFPIGSTDSIREVYENATKFSIELLQKKLADIERIRFIPQDKSLIKVYPQRSPEDGEIDWKKSPKEIHNFIRAQSKPYPGAWTYIDGKKVTIWDAKIEEVENFE